MWFALSLLLMFVGYCWYDSSRASLMNGSEWPNAADDGEDQLRALGEFVDESLETKREEYQGWHEMGFMTPYDLPPATDDT